MQCSSCGQESPAGFRFCGSCGALLGGGARAREVRKVVTIVFCDLSGSTALGHSTDPEALRTTMRGYYAQMRTILERHGGTVEKFIGDAVMAVFGVPVAHEDDALRAVRAAWEMRAAVPTLGLQARIGVNTGGVVAGEGDTLVTGDAVNVAARLEQAAEAGEVLVGAETRRLVRDAVRVEPVDVTAKGKPGPLAAFRLVEVDLEAAAVARRLDMPLVGRRSELDQLRQAFERTVRERRCHLFTVLGAAGVGKSRLLSEFFGELDAALLHGRCLDYGEGITFWPVISVLKQLGPRADETLAHLVGGASTPNELFWTVRTLLEEVAAERPLVLCFDDIHWGEPTFLDLIDHVADLSRGAPILLLCVARPELLDERPGWGGGKLNATTLLLEPLSTGECAELIEAHGGVEPATLARILSAADGNPLFVEEMVALAREDGDVRVPATVQALLQARLDQLGRDERSVIERGAVEGQIFHRGAVMELSRPDDVGPQLVGLVRKELIHPTPTTLAGDHAFRFRHLLIRDAAYDALPKEARADLHERFAVWLGANGEELIELDEVLGYHLEQAARYRRELERADAEVERRAGLRLAAAGSKAVARSDFHGAENLLSRALELLPEADPRRSAVLIDYLATPENAGRSPERLRRIAELEGHPDEAVAMHGRIARLYLRITTDPEDAVSEAERVAEEALVLFAATGDDVGAAHAYHLVAWINWLQSRALPTVAALERLMEHAERAGALALTGRAAIEIMGPLIYGPLTPNDVRARLVPLRAGGSRVALGTILHVEAHLAYREGRFEEALARHREANAIAAELGLELMLINGTTSEAEALRAQGRLDEAIAILREGNRQLEALGQTSFLSTALIELGELLYKRGEPGEAERLAIEGEELGATEDVVNFAFGRGLRAKVAADRGDHESAEILAREAVGYAYRTDFPSVHAKAHEALAYMLASAGRTNEARVETGRALALWERFGYTSEADRARALDG